MAFYAVRKGHTPGVYTNWGDCEQQTKGFGGPVFKKFPTREEADAFVRGVVTTTRPPVSKSTSTRGTASTSKIIAGPDWDVVYSDGACKGNGQHGAKAGVGIWWGPGDPRNIAERCPGDQTNNRAELIAILRTLETVPMTKKSLLIRSDSKYSMDCVNSWIVNWKKRGWKTANGQPVKNDGIIRLIDAHLSRRAQFGQTVKFEYVKGHSGDVGNDGADMQANLGVEGAPLPDRNWTADLERFLRDQDDLEIPPEALEDSGEEVEPPPKKGTVPVTRKRSRSPPRVTVAGPSRTSVATAAPAGPLKTPVRNKAKLTAAIEEALKSPEFGRVTTVDEPVKSPSKPTKPPSRVTVIEAGMKFTQVDPEQPPRKKRVITPPRMGDQKPVMSSNNRKPASKSSRIADMEAALSSAPAVNSPTKTNSSGSMSARTLFTSAAAAPDLGSSNGPSHEDYPVRVIYALPPLVPVQREEVNFEDYADCLLSDEELRHEIE